jgi:hypothetical protein
MLTPYFTKAQLNQLPKLYETENIALKDKKGHSETIPNGSSGQNNASFEQEFPHVYAELPGILRKNLM